jgi:hypothetical protein
LVHFMQMWPFATRSRMELYVFKYIQFHPIPGSKRSQLHKIYQSWCTAKNTWWWAERLTETCRVVIPKNWNSVYLLDLFTTNLIQVGPIC